VVQAGRLGRNVVLQHQRLPVDDTKVLIGDTQIGAGGPVDERDVYFSTRCQEKRQSKAERTKLTRPTAQKLGGHQLHRQGIIVVEIGKQPGRGAQHGPADGPLLILNRPVLPSNDHVRVAAPGQC